MADGALLGTVEVSARTNSRHLLIEVVIYGAATLRTIAKPDGLDGGYHSGGAVVSRVTASAPTSAGGSLRKRSHPALCCRVPERTCSNREKAGEALDHAAVSAVRDTPEFAGYGNVLLPERRARDPTVRGG